MFRLGPGGEMVDAADSKSASGNGVLVRVRPGAPHWKWYMQKRFESGWDKEFRLVLSFRYPICVKSDRNGTIQIDERF